MAQAKPLNYLTFLRELEKATAAAANKESAADRSKVHRGGAQFSQLVPWLEQTLTNIGKDQEKKISKALGMKRELLARTEQAMLRNLEALTERRGPYAEAPNGTFWPPSIPAGRIVERFVGQVIGLHSESPGTALKVHVRTALEEVVCPALGWNVVCQIGEFDYSSRGRIQEAVRQRIMALPLEPRVENAELSLGGDTAAKITLPCLRLIAGWVRTLTLKDCEWRLDQNELQAFLHELRAKVDEAAHDGWALVDKQLKTQFGSQGFGSERARVVAMAHKRAPQSAAFLRERLTLLAAARLPELEPFRLLCETNVQQAAKEAREWADQGVNRDAPDFPEKAAGRAYWLARQAFGQHDRPAFLTADPSDAVVDLLNLASARVGSGEETKRAYCLRFAAGFATNPRYHRSESVLAQQESLVRAYAGCRAARANLVAMFEARIAWQCHHCRPALKAERREAAAHYARALKHDEDAMSGLDSEAPVHLFPELVTFLQSGKDKSANTRNLLETVDFIVQKNHGIYFDIEAESELIDAGLEQMREFYEKGLHELQKRLRKQADPVPPQDWSPRDFIRLWYEDQEKRGGLKHNRE